MTTSAERQGLGPRAEPSDLHAEKSCFRRAWPACLSPLKDYASSRQQEEEVVRRPTWKQYLSKGELPQAGLWRDVWAEFFGSVLLTTASIGAVLSSFGQQPGAASPPRVDPPALTIAFSHFLLLGLLIMATGGSHMNPLISCFTMLTGVTGPLRSLAYVLAQAVGACVASLMMKVALPLETQLWTMNEEGQGRLAGCAAGSQIDAEQLFLIEFAFSTFYLLVTHKVAFAKEQSLAAGPIVGPLLISGTLGVLIWSSGTLVPAGFSGAVMNPARCLGPMLAGGAGNSDSWWVYWAAAVSAAGCSALISRLLQAPEPEAEAEDPEAPMLPTLSECRGSPSHRLTGASTTPRSAAPDPAAVRKMRSCPHFAAHARQGARSG